MIKFINLDNGYTYMGDQPYIHWFPGEQSTNIMYTMPLCFMSECNTISAHMVPDVFYLLNIQQSKPEENINLNDVSYADIDKMVFFPSDEQPEMFLEGVPYTINDQTYYIYLIYILGQTENGCEYISDLTVREYNGDSITKSIFKIGADFYEENENLNILLSNFGINIPESIQKCFWDSNVYEEKPDNIIINRKFKELLSNYWDIIANKGSYKSLVNSLKWFEWGEDLIIKDVWAKSDWDLIRYEEKPLINFLTEKYKSTFQGFAKTTFISLSYALRKLQKDNVHYENFNPILTNTVNKWSKIDLMLKLSLLHRFYETYFLPIHEQVFHATVDDLIFTDPIRICNGNDNHKENYLYNTKTIDVKINDGKPVQVSNVSVGVDKDTLFGNPYIGETAYESSINDDGEIITKKHTIVGVKDLKDVGSIIDGDTEYINELLKKNINELNDEERVKRLEYEKNIKTFYIQNYNGLGAIVPISCTLDLGTDKDDIVYSESISINLGPNTVSFFGDETIDGYDTWDSDFITLHDNKIFHWTSYDEKTGHYYTKIDFNILCKTHSIMDVRCKLLFKTIGGQIFAKTVEFPIYSNANVNLHYYRVNHIDNVASLYENKNIPNIPNNYLLNNIPLSEEEYNKSIANTKPTIYKKYLPTRNLKKITYLAGIDKCFVKASQYTTINNVIEDVECSEKFEVNTENNSGGYDFKINNKENIYAHTVKLFVPINNNEFLKNLEYNVNFGIKGNDIQYDVTAQCYICDKNDYNIYSDQITLGMINEDAPKIDINSSFVINQDIPVLKDNNNVYLCIMLTSFDAWGNIEIHDLNISCPNMGGVALNNLLILKEWELSQKQSWLDTHYIVHEKTTDDNMAIEFAADLQYDKNDKNIIVDNHRFDFRVENWLSQRESDFIIERSLDGVKYDYIKINLYGLGDIPDGANIKIELLDKDNTAKVLSTYNYQYNSNNGFAIVEQTPNIGNIRFTMIAGEWNGWHIIVTPYKIRKYYVCVSKEFWYDPTELLKSISDVAVYRNDMIFFPEHHKLVPFGKIKSIDEKGVVKYIRSDKEEDYTLRNNDVLAVIPRIYCNGETVDFNWSGEIDSDQSTWVFKNTVTGKEYKYNYIQQPYVLGDDGDLEPGYYSITFTYRLTEPDVTHQVKSGSLFIKK